jgi:hypothetical protein
MKAVNGKILVRCNMRQKDEITINGVTIKMALPFEVNYREKSPVLVAVVEGNKWVKKDDILIVHHNTLYTPSPFFLGGELFSIPFTGKIVFGKLNGDGSLTPLGGNLFGIRVEIPISLPLPPEQRKTYIDRVLVSNAGELPYEKDQLIFTSPSAAYDIVYNYNKTINRVTKVHSDFIIAYIK